MKSAAGSVGMNRFRKKRTWRNTWEGMIPKLLLLCALISILTTLGIVFTLIVETASFFQDVPFVQFTTGTEWTALFHESTTIRRVTVDYRNIVGDHGRGDGGDPHRTGFGHLPE